MFKYITEAEWYLIGASLLFVLFFFFFIYFLYKIKEKQNTFVTSEKELKSQFSETLLQTQLEIKEETLQHIGQELHDNLGQVASLIKIHLNTLPLSDPQKAAEKIEDTKELVRQLIFDIKSLSLSLGTNKIQKVGLAKAIRSEIQRLKKLEQFTISYSGVEDITGLDDAKAIILYRMFQESCNNIIKHSQAKHIHVLLTESNKLLTLVIHDDGIGFNTDLLSSSGSGIENLKNRATLIKSTLTINSEKQKGTTISITLSLNHVATESNNQTSFS